ncbi:MAG: class I SAM-dependent methyltransferase [Bacteroidia bacterium]
MTELIKKIYKRLRFMYFKRRTPKTDEDFYKVFYTMNPNWSRPEPNQDESLRWSEIEKSIETLQIEIKNKNILEIGCGRGWLCHKLTKMGAITVGIDPIAPVIKYAQKLFPSNEFHTAIPSEYLGQNPNLKFDSIVTSEVIEHVLNKEEFLQNTFDLLKKDGYLLLTTPRLEHYKDFIDIYGEDIQQPVEEWVSESQLKELFEKTGFTVLYKNFFSPLPHPTKTMNVYQIWVCKK